MYGQIWMETQTTAVAAPGCDNGKTWLDLFIVSLSDSLRNMHVLIYLIEPSHHVCTGKFQNYQNKTFLSGKHWSPIRGEDFSLETDRKANEWMPRTTVFPRK